jgi:hypothetical protein
LAGVKPLMNFRITGNPEPLILSASYFLVSMPSSLSVLAAVAPSSEALTFLSIFRIFPFFPI